jgi:amphi-Trp domain-containing protein
MIRKNAERDVEKVVSRAAFARKLRRLADAVETGRPFRIQVAGEKLTVPAAAEMSIEHEREEGAEELEFQLRWKSRG